MAHVKLTPEVTAILERSTITGNTLILPPGQLERKLYEAVNAALVNAGGKWNRSAKGHVFPSDPRAKLGLILETGVSEDTQKTNQAFYTPPELARRVVLMASVEGMRVLEPSVGEGALANVCREAGAIEILGIEYNTDAAELARKNGTAVLSADFLKVVQKDPATRSNDPSGLFDRVVMNPPFTKKQDLRHVAHALNFLKPGGRLVAIMQGNRTVSDIRQFAGDKCSVMIKHVEAGAFKESGTNIATVIVTIDT